MARLATAAVAATAVALVSVLRPASAAAAAQGAAAGQQEMELKTNWQDGWREDLHSCMRTKKAVFTRNGKPISRQLQEIPKALAELMLKGSRKPREAREKKKQQAQKPRAKLTKKERMRQELLGSLAGSFNEVADVLPQKDTEHELYEQQAQNFITQAAQRAKLRPEDEVTLKEFCDIIWRSGNASPLDSDDVFPKPGGEDAEL
mmetsp:Transcript_60752/g.180987  ORF Transcript_60752/g.180987 Transcript_60752/m.180987 type:complete len:204 (-) Transcript_60752:137-748(-)